jgi:uncharacterized protein (DUF2235 family)
MPKNLVICCDGTGEEYGDNNSNVVKIYSLLENSTRQLTYYHPGLGTMGSRFAPTKVGRFWSKLKGLAFGAGLMDNLTDAYVFLMNQYEEGDAVYLFGFSRGAYTVRALAAFLHMYGLMHKGNESLVPYAIRRFRKKIRDQHSFEIAHGFKQTFSRQCRPHFLGVWDTVSSVGWIYDPLHLPYTKHNPDVQICRHAVSIDERRCQFRQNLWEPLPGQDSRQLWFAGTHCDVGGGLGSANSGLSDIALRWMFDEAIAAGLLATRMPDGAGDPCSAIHPSLTFVWWLLEILPKRYVDMSCTPPQVRWRIPLGSCRFMVEGSVLHRSVEERMKNSGYGPSNLPKTYTFDGTLLAPCKSKAAAEGRGS